PRLSPRPRGAPARAPLPPHACPRTYGRPSDAATPIRRLPAPALLHLRRPAQRLLRAQRPLRREQLLLRAPRAPPLLAADARPLGRGGLGHAAHPRLELVEQLAAGEEAVEGLRALALALDDHAARPVAQHDAGRHLVDVLPALPARAHEVLLQVLLAHAERPHARGEGVLLLGRDGEHAGRLTIRPVGWPPRRRRGRKPRADRERQRFRAPPGASHAAGRRAREARPRGPHPGGARAARAPRPG